jgi:hypothetical protein
MKKKGTSLENSSGKYIVQFVNKIKLAILKPLCISDYAPPFKSSLPVGSIHTSKTLLHCKNADTYRLDESIHSPIILIISGLVSTKAMENCTPATTVTTISTQGAITNTDTIMVTFTIVSIMLIATEIDIVTTITFNDVTQTQIIIEDGTIMAATIVISEHKLDKHRKYDGSHYKKDEDFDED